MTTWSKFVLIHLFLWLIILLISGYFGHIDKIDFFLYLSTVTRSLGVTLAVHFIFKFLVLAIRRSKSPLTDILKDYRIRFLNLKSMLYSTIIITFFGINCSIYTSFKVLIPQINPFNYDLLFFNLDKYMHFGYSPWEITHSVLPNAILTVLINTIYNIWFLVFWVFVCSVIFSLESIKLKLATISSFSMVWIINGSVLAVIFSSAGPCFFDSVVDISIVPDYYSDLMRTLTEQQNLLEKNGIWLEIRALMIQDYLWSAYTDQSTDFAAGISAFPSMHVSVAMLIWLITREYFPKLGKPALLFLVLIMVGSVHLGWHYAVDGYMSIVTTYVIWRFCKAIFMLGNDGVRDLESELIK
ncbi:phosphatase PAP2 family protein [Vibrio breoganii]|uniref:phosphatase PAP2 family protein n=1 Tax=Vibrio breoganii TaxID=553239 RepID=UPI002905631C|nr:phosphatase PAP2 family protein [Vibrio breoganii]